MKVGVITQARMTSSRLPGKVLLEAGGRTMLEHHLARLGPAGAQVIVATTVNGSDDPVAELAARLGFPVFRGSEADVLSRYAGAAREHDLDVVVRVTSDCPLIDGELVKLGIDRFLAEGDEDAYVSNALVRTYPRGLDFEVFSAAALLRADAEATSAIEREHVTPYLYAREGTGNPRIHVTRDADASGLRITLDTPEDFELISRLIEQHDALDLNAERLIELLEAHPELTRLNEQIEQKKLGR